MPSAPHTGTPGGQGERRMPVCEMTGAFNLRRRAMQSDTTQLDLYRDSPQMQAQAWRTAAETARQQYPNDERRYAYYLRGAEKLEAE